MEKKVRLTLTNRQTDGTGEVTVTKQSVTGQYYEKDDGFYLLYEDSPEENGAASRNRIRLKGSVLELTKRGGISSRMVFEPGKEYVTDYVTPCGCLKMGVSTLSLETVHKEDRLLIRLEYSLTSEGTLISRCALEIQVLFPS